VTISNSLRPGEVISAVTLDTEDVPPAFALLPAYPNPFNHAAVLPFHVARSGRVRVQVFALTGQPVRTLVDAQLPAGIHQATWDGRADDGRPRLRACIWSACAASPAGPVTMTCKLMRLD
jgi:hypothetical protein